MTDRDNSSSLFPLPSSSGNWYQSQTHGTSHKSANFPKIACGNKNNMQEQGTCQIWYLAMLSKLSDDARKVRRKEEEIQVLNNVHMSFIIYG